MMLAFASMAYEFARVDEFTEVVATSHAPLTPFTLFFFSLATLSSSITRRLGYLNIAGAAVVAAAANLVGAADSVNLTPALVLVEHSAALLLALARSFAKATEASSVSSVVRLNEFILFKIRPKHHFGGNVPDVQVQRQQARQKWGSPRR
jgi:hypothetical protein